MKLLITEEWLRKKIESDPDLDCEAGVSGEFLVPVLDTFTVKGIPCYSVAAPIELSEGAPELHGKPITLFLKEKLLLGICHVVALPLVRGPIRKGQAISIALEELLEEKEE